jgi:hypothetical protein
MDDLDGSMISPAGIALGATLIAGSAFASFASAQTDTPLDIPVTAALLYNFAKFTEWPAAVPGIPIAFCIVGGEQIADALVETVRGHRIGGRTLEVWRPHHSASWPGCHVLFIAAAEARRSATGLSGLRTAPVLTVSDGEGFSQGQGMIELYVEDERFRFAINVDAVERSGLRLSSRLLGLAKVVRDRHAP